jgi:hypothetical protein
MPIEFLNDCTVTGTITATSNIISGGGIIHDFGTSFPTPLLGLAGYNSAYGEYFRWNGTYWLGLTPKQLVLKLDTTTGWYKSVSTATTIAITMNSTGQPIFIKNVEFGRYHTGTYSSGNHLNWVVSRQDASGTSTQIGPTTSDYDVAFATNIANRISVGYGGKFTYNEVRQIILSSTITGTPGTTNISGDVVCNYFLVGS